MDARSSAWWAFSSSERVCSGSRSPFTRNFEEVNLRFYVRRKAGGLWRRGVVFVKEIVPQWATALVARSVYGENYVSLPMRHVIDSAAAGARRRSSTNGGASDHGRACRWPSPVRRRFPHEDTEEAFITEHYWGYSRQLDRTTIEYQVEHPRWRVWPASAAQLSCDVGSLYGAEFVSALSGSPSSAFAAEGSPIVVRRGRRLT